MAHVSSVCVGSKNNRTPTRRALSARLVGLVVCVAAMAAASATAPIGSARAQGPLAPVPVPLIIDTDMFSSADDVGALATAFGLQLRGEAKVIAVGVNTRLRRVLPPDSWRCTAAIAAFYNSSSVPIGSALPNNGTEKNVPDWAGPCAALAPAAYPVPEAAVVVYRRALISQPDNSVVIASVGYLGLLSALLDSPADSISSLTGAQLVAKKVKVLVAMGGGYPSRAGENNLIGDPASARNVASRWPTKLVWSGYEVGDAIHTGNTISSVHPANSPVRVAYEAFVKPNNWIYSYDLTAVYHAIRPADPLLTAQGPGTNVIDLTGGNVFTMGSGNQYYLRLSNARSLETAIETLLDTLPSSGNQAPAISITSPEQGASVQAGQPLTVSGSSSDPDGSVTLIEVFDNGSLVGSTSGDPYSVTFTPTIIGAHTITARALDNGGAQTTSPPVAVDVVSSTSTSTSTTTSTTTSTSTTTTTTVPDSTSEMTFGGIGPVATRTKSGNLTASYPTGTSTNDLLFLVEVNATDQEIPKPSGWNLLTDERTGSPKYRVTVWWKLAGPETSVSTKVHTDSKGASLWVARYLRSSGYPPSPALAMASARSGTVSASTSMTPDEAITTTKANATVISIVAVRAGSNLSLANANGFTMRSITIKTGAQPVTLAIADKLVPANGSTQIAPTWAQSGDLGKWSWSSIAIA